MAFLGRVLLIAFVALLVGAWDSARRPVQTAARPVAPATNTTPASSTQTQGQTPSPTTETSPATAGAATPSATPAAATLGKDITVAQAKTLFDAGATFVDARSDAEWASGHIPLAVHLSGEMFSATDGRATDVLRQLDPGAATVIYCGGGDCHASEQVYIYLQQAGFSQLHILTDGVPGWTAAGLPWEKAGTP